MDRGCEGKKILWRDENYYHHNLCSIFSKNNEDDGREVREPKR